MKVINHQKGNYTFVSVLDSSIMYGTIEMTQKEFNECIKYLKGAKRSKDTYVRDSLRHVFNYTLPKMSPCQDRVCLGVCATELIFSRFKLPRYKKQNYVIKII